MRPPAKSVHKTSLAVGFASIRQRGRQMLQCRSIALSNGYIYARRTPEVMSSGIGISFAIMYSVLDSCIITCSPIMATQVLE